MRVTTLITFIFTGLFLLSCVPKKDYIELEDQYNQTRAELAQTTQERDELQGKMDVITNRVEEFRSKITELQEANAESLKEYDKIVMSDKDKAKLKERLKDVDPEELAKARTLEDSVNLALSYNLNKKVNENFDDENNDDIDVNIDDTVVIITISDKLLFKSGSYRVSKEADKFLEKLAFLINSEPSVEVLIEGHTDDTRVRKGSYLKDNWQLSVERSTAVVRKLQKDHGVAPERMIAAGRGSYKPVFKNDTDIGKSRNRRTRVAIVPNVDKFLSLIFTD